MPAATADKQRPERREKITALSGTQPAEAETATATKTEHGASTHPNELITALANYSPDPQPTSHGIIKGTWRGSHGIHFARRHRTHTILEKCIGEGTGI